jgi:rod shape-determining protein MreC
MYTMRRWWGRYSSQFVWASVALGIALFIRYTEASPVYQVYELLSRPFQLSETDRSQLTNAKILQLEQRVAVLEKENNKLEKLLGYVSQDAKTSIAAPVIGRSADRWWQLVTLGRGSKHGIRKNDLVTTEPGVVVGLIHSVTPNTSQVLLISDPTFKMGVAVTRSRNLGLMRGASGTKAVMEFFDKLPDVKPGDVISTSSLSQLFPVGLPVGVVESLNLKASPAPEAVINLSAPMNALEWVVVSPSVQKSPDLLNDAPSTSEEIQ